MLDSVIEQFSDACRYLDQINQRIQRIQIKAGTQINAEAIFEDVKLLFDQSMYYKENDEAVVRLLKEIIGLVVERLKQQLRLEIPRKNLLLFELPNFQYHYNAIRTLSVHLQQQFKQLKFNLKLHSSEAAVFTSFELLLQRLSDLYFILRTESDLSTLDKCTIEGADEINSKRHNLIQPFIAPQYDYFDDNATQFIKDISKYRESVSHIEELVLELAQRESNKSQTMWQ